MPVAGLLQSVLYCVNDLLRLRLPCACTKSISYASGAAPVLPTEADGRDLDAIIKLDSRLVDHVWEVLGALVLSWVRTSRVFVPFLESKRTGCPTGCYRSLRSSMCSVSILNEWFRGEGCPSNLLQLTNRFLRAVRWENVVRTWVRRSVQPKFHYNIYRPKITRNSVMTSRSLMADVRSGIAVRAGCGTFPPKVWPYIPLQKYFMKLSLCIGA